MSQELIDRSRSTLERVSEAWNRQGARVDPQPRRKGLKPLGSRIIRTLDWVPGLEKAQHRVDGHELVFWQTGPETAPRVVLLHGFGASKENWLSLLFLLRRHYRLLIPDLPGFGESDYRPDARYHYQAQAARLANWLREMGEESAHWVGSSMGGGITVALGAGHPDVVRSLTLMNAAGVGALTPSGLDQALLSGSNFLIPRAYRDVDRLFQRVTYRNRHLWRILFAPFVAGDMTRRNAMATHIFSDMLNPEQDLIQLAPKVEAPVLLLWGDRDEVVDASCGQVYQALIPHARLEVMERIGHLPMLEAPGATARLLRRFFGQGLA